MEEKFVDIGSATILKNSVAAIELREGKARDWLFALGWMFGIMLILIFLHWHLILAWSLPTYYYVCALFSERYDVVVRTTSKSYHVQTFRQWQWSKGNANNEARQLVETLKSKLNS